MNINFSRSWQRTNVTIILDEQIELIRQARSWLNAEPTATPTEIESVAIPGSSWKIALDREQRTLELTLLNAPAWVTTSNVLGEGFYPMPLDGTVSWKFGPQVKAVITQR